MISGFRTGALCGLAAVVAASLLGGCRGCKEERPYTPFGVATSPLPRVDGAPKADAAIEEDADHFAPRKAARAPASVTEWSPDGADGLRLSAPDGQELVLGLVADFNGDGMPDAVAWTREPEGAGDGPRGELWFYPGRDEQPKEPLRPGRRVGKIPSFVPTGPDCRLSTELTQTGPQTVTLDVTASCEGPLIPRSPTRGIVVLAPAAPRPQVLALRLAPPAPGEHMSVTVVTTDQDADGRDDVELSMTVRAEGTEREATARLAWLDRAAGNSRDAREPVKSLTSLGSTEVVRARGKNTALRVPEAIGNARRLYASLCAESGVPRIFDEEGDPIRCGDLSGAFEWYATAELRAALTRGDVLEAVAALERAGWYHAPLSDAARAGLQAEIMGAAKERGIEALPVAAVPRAPGSMPRWSPLRFEEDGGLLVLTVEGVMRSTADGRHVEDAAEEIDPWPMTVIAGDESRWAGVGLPCDRSEVVLLMTDADGVPIDPLATRLLAPRPGACGGSSAPPLAPAVPVEWASDRRISIVAGSLVGLPPDGRLGPTVTPGSPRSPDGRHLVAVSGLGLVVVGPERTELWHGEALGNPAHLADCVVANEARAVACVRDGRAVTFRPADG